MPEVALHQGADMMLGSHKTVAPMAQSREVSPEDQDEQREIQMILAWQREDANYRKTFDSAWDERTKAYKGKTWQNQKTSGSAKSKPEMNLIRVVIQTILPILTDANPGFDVLPKKPTDNKFVRMLSEAVSSLWERLGMPIRIVEVLMDQSILDCGILKVYWNPDLEDGRGDIDIEVKDPRNVWVNKGAIDFDRECTRVIERVTKTVGEWKRLFPAQAHRIHADSNSEQRQKDEQERPTSEVKLVSPVDQDKNKDQDVGVGVSDDENSFAEGWEVWYKDETLEEYELGKDEKTGEDKGKELRKKFPNGHLTTILPWQRVRLQSVENPNEGPNFNPYVRFVDTVMPRSFYGEGLCESLIDIQKMLNKTAQAILEYLRLMANPIWIKDKNAGVSADKITNKVGLVIDKEPGTDVRRDFPEPLSSTVFEFFRLLQAFANEISGVHDVTQGRKPTGITAAEAIDALVEAAHTRVRLKERNMQVSLSKLARLVIAIMLQKYRGARFQRVAGDASAAPAFVEFGIEDAGDNNLKITRSNWKFNPERGEYEQSPFETATAVKSLFDVKVQAGTAMPFAKAQKSSLALKLYEAAAIDQTALLEVLEWEKAQEVIQRMEQKKQEEAALAATPPPLPVAA